MPPVGKERGKVVPSFVTRSIQSRRWPRIPSTGGHSPQRLARCAKDDLSLAAPRAPPEGPCWQIADGLRWTARNIYLLELPLAGKYDEPAVGGPEGIAGSIGIGQRVGFERIQGPN